MQTQCSGYQDIADLFMEDDLAFEPRSVRKQRLLANDTAEFPFWLMVVVNELTTLMRDGECHDTA